MSSGSATAESSDLLARLVRTGDLQLRIEMSIDSRTTEVTPVVVIGFPGGAQLVKALADLDLPDGMDVDID